MQALFPGIKPNQTYRFSVENPHELYVEESGNPNGIPVIVVHGGPGAGSHPDQRRFFDPSKYRIVLFDQRGCGQSTPHSALDNNHTQALVADMEIIREKLDIEQWVILGGSWGATLALIYAQTHPKRVKAMILRSVLLGNQADKDWFFKNGANRVFPEAWDEFIKPIERKKRDNIIAAYEELLTSDNELTRMAAANAWSTWHRQCSTLRPTPEEKNQLAKTLRLATIECHYVKNNFFMEENQILKNIMLLRNVPATIIHGRYDMISCYKNAYDLAERWPQAELITVCEAGHASHETGISDAIVRATNKLAGIR